MLFWNHQWSRRGAHFQSVTCSCSYRFPYKSSHPPSSAPLFHFFWGVNTSPSLHLLLLQELAADLAAADFGALLASLQGLLPWRIVKLLVRIHSGEPEAVLIGEVVAGALGAVALDEWRRAEILQAGARGHQRLTATLSASCCVLHRRGEKISRKESKNASLPLWTLYMFVK